MRGGCGGCLFFFGDLERPGPCFVFPGAWLTAIHRCPAQVSREDAPPDLRAYLARGEKVPDEILWPPTPGAANPTAEILTTAIAALAVRYPDAAQRQLAERNLTALAELARQDPSLESRWRAEEFRERWSAAEADRAPVDDLGDGAGGLFGDMDPPTLPTGDAP